MSERVIKAVVRGEVVKIRFSPEVSAFLDLIEELPKRLTVKTISQEVRQKNNDYWKSARGLEETHASDEAYGFAGKRAWNTWNTWSTMCKFGTMAGALAIRIIRGEISSSEAMCSLKEYIEAPTQFPPEVSEYLRELEKLPKKLTVKTIGREVEYENSAIRARSRGIPEKHAFDLAFEVAELAAWSDYAPCIPINLFAKMAGALAIRIIRGEISSSEAMCSLKEYIASE